MHCLGKEYRVVCTKTPQCQLMIDIVPADQSLYQLVLKERLVRNKDTKILAGSIKLYDMGEGNRPEILFLPPESGSLEHIELSPAEENHLRYKITQRFNDMISKDLDSTITVRHEIHQEYVNGIISQMVRECDLMVDAPKSITEENELLSEEHRRHKQKTQAQTASYLAARDAKYSPYHLTCLQIKQLLHRSD